MKTMLTVTHNVYMITTTTKRTHIGILCHLLAVVDIEIDLLGASQEGIVRKLSFLFSNIRNFFCYGWCGIYKNNMRFNRPRRNFVA